MYDRVRITPSILWFIDKRNVHSNGRRYWSVFKILRQEFRYKTQQQKLDKSLIPSNRPSPYTNIVI